MIPQLLVIVGLGEKKTIRIKQSLTFISTCLEIEHLKIEDLVFCLLYVLFHLFSHLMSTLIVGSILWWKQQRQGTEEQWSTWAELLRQAMGLVP